MKLGMVESLAITALFAVAIAIISAAARGESSDICSAFSGATRSGETLTGNARNPISDVSVGHLLARRLEE